MADYFEASNSNTHGMFAASEETDALIAEARRAASDVTGAEPDEVVFGQNATTLLFHLARAVARTLGPGDEIVVTRLDHDANIRPWITAATDAGATVRWVDVRTDDVTLDLASLEEALSDRTRLVACTLASNAAGSIPPAARIANLAHEAGALVALDGVHFAQHRALDARGLGADILACSPYKFFGPHLGILAVRRELLAEWTPDKVRPSPDGVPERWETGTLSHEALAGLVAAVDYLAQVGTEFAGAVPQDSRRRRLVLGYEAIGAHERDLARRFLEGLEPLEHVRLLGIADTARLGERTPTFALRVGDRRPADVCRTLGDRGIFTWDGDYYAVELMDRLGLGGNAGGAVRIGFCHYTSAGEVDRVLAELSSLAD
jgi:cysteine desulfurase family protein (TIGR01976 family)